MGYSATYVSGDIAKVGVDLIVGVGASIKKFLP